MSGTDEELVESLLASPSEAEAVMAALVLRRTLSDDALLELLNLRELMGQLPEPPFVTGTSLDVLEMQQGYESTGRSYRKLLDAPDGSLFGIEFLGEGLRCEGVVIHTMCARVALGRRAGPARTGELSTALGGCPGLVTELAAALESLGWTLALDMHESVESYLGAHAARAASEALGELF